MESRCDLTCLVSQWLKQNFRIYAFYPFWSSKKFWQFLKAYFSPQIRWQTRHPREKYNETPPYGHLVGTATFFGRLAKTAIHFRVKKKPSSIRPFFLGPFSDRINEVPLYSQIHTIYGWQEEVISSRNIPPSGVNSVGKIQANPAGVRSTSSTSFTVFTKIRVNLV